MPIKLNKAIYIRLHYPLPEASLCTCTHTNIEACLEGVHICFTKNVMGKFDVRFLRVGKNSLKMKINLAKNKIYNNKVAQKQPRNRSLKSNTIITQLELEDLLGREKSFLVETVESDPEERKCENQPEPKQQGAK